MNASNIEEFGSEWWGELSNLIGKSELDGLVCCEVQIPVPQHRPFFWGQPEMLSEDLRHPSVIEPHALSNGLQMGGISRNDGAGGQMYVKGGNFGRLAMGCSKEGYRSDGLDASAVVEGQSERDALEEVVQRNTVGDESSIRLEHDMRVFDASVAGYPDRVENALDRRLVDCIGEDAIDFWWQLGRLRSH